MRALRRRTAGGAVITLALDLRPINARAFAGLITFWCYGPMRHGTQDRWGN